MWRLIRFRARAHDERGAVAVVMAILIPAVFLGVGALVLNVGGWYVARGMDQNGADAAAVAVAKLCGDSCDQGAAEVEAAKFADSASNGQLAGQATFVCGTLPGLSNACNSANENGKICPPAPGNGAPYVDVLVAPEGGEMDNLANSDTQAIAACAQATLSGPSSCEGCVALTISKCEWDISTGGGEDFVTHEPNTGYSNDAPPSFVDTITARRASGLFNEGGSNYYVANQIDDPQTPKGSATIAGSETLLFTHGGDSCGGGQNAPGQFGWLPDSGGCNADITGSTYEGNTGNDPVRDCKTIFAESRDNATPIYLPVYSNAVGNGAGTTYTLEGFAAFVVTGWNVGNFGSNKTADSRVAEADSSSGFRHDRETYCGGQPDKGWYTASPSDICISGYFTQALADSGPSGSGGENLGLTVASLSG